MLSENTSNWESKNITRLWACFETGGWAPIITGAGARFAIPISSLPSLLGQSISSVLSWIEHQIALFSYSNFWESRHWTICFWNKASGCVTCTLMISAQMSCCLLQWAHRPLNRGIIINFVKPYTKELSEEWLPIITLWNLIERRIGHSRYWLGRQASKTKKKKKTPHG